MALDMQDNKNNTEMLSSNLSGVDTKSLEDALQAIIVQAEDIRKYLDNAAAHKAASEQSLFSAFKDNATSVDTLHGISSDGINIMKHLADSKYAPEPEAKI